MQFACIQNNKHNKLICSIKRFNKNSLTALYLWELIMSIKVTIS